MPLQENVGFYLSNMAETCCELAIVVSWIVTVLLVAIAFSAETHSLHAAARVTTVVPCPPHRDVT